MIENPPAAGFDRRVAIAVQQADRDAVDFVGEQCVDRCMQRILVERRKRFAICTDTLPDGIHPLARDEQILLVDIDQCARPYAQSGHWSRVSCRE